MISNFFKINGKILFFCFAWAGIILTYTLIRVNIVDIPLDRDEGFFGYVGQVILDHGLPYRDAFDQKPPVVFYINALALLFVPPTSTGIHLFLHIYNFITLISLFIFSKMLFHSNAVGLWAAFTYAVFSSSPEIQGFTASTEMFLLLPMILSLLFALLALQKNQLLIFLISGIFGALTFWTKQTGILILIFIPFFLVISQPKVPPKQNINYQKILKSFLVWGTGFLSTSFAIAGYFFYHGALDEFVYWSFTHSFYYSYYYSKGSIFYYFPKIFQQLVNIFHGNFLIISVGLFMSLWGIFRKNIEGLLSCGFLFFSLLATVPGYAYRHYFAQIAPAVAIAGGAGFSLIINKIENKKARTLLSIFFCLIIVASPLFVHSGYYLKDSPNEISGNYYGNNPFPESIELAKYISNRTDKNDYVYIYGSEAQIFLYSKRKSATSFALIYPLMASFPRYKEFQKKAWKEITTNSPKYIVVINLLRSHLYDGKADLWIERQTKQKIDREYYLEAVMPIKKPRGKILSLSKESDLNKIMKKSKFPIYIFRRK